ncbi:MAG: hypothetical protein AAFS10_12110 [Myxococcota bacterium]
MSLNTLLTQLRLAVTSNNTQLLLESLRGSVLDLLIQPAVQDYLWNHRGYTLLDALAADRPLSPQEQELVAWMPQSSPALSAHACDIELSEATRASAASALRQLRAHFTPLHLQEVVMSNTRKSDDDDGHPAMPQANIQGENEEEEEVLDELFGPSDGDPFHGDPISHQIPLTPTVGGRSSIIGLAHKGLALTEIRHDDYAELTLSATLIHYDPNHTVTLGRLALILRDRDGHILDLLDSWMDIEFRRSQELLHTFEVSHEALEALDTVSIEIDIDIDFRGRLFTAPCGPLPEPTGPRRRLPLESRPTQRLKAFELQADLDLYIHSPGRPQVELIMTLQEGSRSVIRDRDLVVAFRSAKGDVLHRIGQDVSIPVGAPRHIRAEFGYGDDEAPLFEASQVASVEVALQGRYTGHEQLGVFRRSD